jgi:hypothetical protein
MENELERDTLGGGTVGIVGTDCGRDGVVVVYETNWPVPVNGMSEWVGYRMNGWTNHLSRVPSSLSNHHSSSFKTLAAASSKTTSIKNFLISGMSNGR